MKPREQWRPILEAENVCYEVKFESKKYQVEVEILENTDSYVHVMVAVDDGHLWRAMRPLCSSFICKK